MILSPRYLPTRCLLSGSGAAPATECRLPAAAACFRTRDDLMLVLGIKILDSTLRHDIVILLLKESNRVPSGRFPGSHFMSSWFLTGGKEEESRTNPGN